MAECQITIAGPGGVINNELVVIKKALLDIGYTVTVKNDHPAKIDPDEHLLLIKDLPKKGEVEIIMKHYPWGG